jgi:chromosome partitioning protein
MAYLIGVVSQKGGVGKSTITRLLAREFAALDWDVKVADLDVKQGTMASWARRRNQNGITPEVAVQQYPSFTKALKDSENHDVMIFDGQPHASSQTAEVAKAVDLVIIPTGVAEDDHEPGRELASELVNKVGVDRKKIGFAFCRVPKAPGLIAEAYYALTDRDWHVFDGGVPEQAGFAEAHNEGKAISETRFGSLNAHAEQLANDIMTLLKQRTKARAT